MTPEQKHMGHVAALGCICCRLLYGEHDVPCQVHHLREGRVKRNDFLTIGLCREHHLGSRQSVHLAKRALLDALHMESEYDLLAETYLLLFKAGKFQ